MVREYGTRRLWGFVFKELILIWIKIAIIILIFEYDREGDCWRAAGRRPSRNHIPLLPSRIFFMKETAV